MVDVEDPPQDQKAWIDQMNDQLDEIEVGLNKIEAYDRTLALAKERLNGLRKRGYGTSPMAQTLDLMIKSLEGDGS